MNVWDIKSMRFPLSILISTLLIACNCGICSNDVLREVTSPDGKYIVSIFERNCGATTPFVRVVSIRSAGNRFNPDAYDDWVFTIHSQSDINANWVDNSNLKIYYSGKGDKPTKREHWKEITISYE